MTSSTTSSPCSEEVRNGQRGAPFGDSGRGAAVELWLFGSSGGQSARAAGVLGLPFVANYHVIPAPPSTPLRPTGRRSRRPRFSTSPTSWCPRMCLWRKQIRKRSIWLHRFRAGFTASAAGTAPCPTQIPDDRSVGARARRIGRGPSRHAVRGNVRHGPEKLDGLQRAVGAKELLVTTITYDHQDRLRSHELLAKEWGTG
jgi:hypothetical protein